MDSTAHTTLIDTYGARNYAPLPVVISRAEGVWVWDVEGNKYLDCLGGYSALNHGHRHPKIIAALIEQAGKVTLTSRAFNNDQFGPFCKELAAMAGLPKVLPMNTGAEAVETAIKAARKWGHTVKGVPDGEAHIIACDGNFHGRTTTIISFSTDEQARAGFGPYTPGFSLASYGDAKEIEAAITEHTVALLVEPIQGEGGIIVPPDGYLRELRRITREKNVLLMLDEIQTGFGRTGKAFCYQHEQGVDPDVVIMGKALGGGVFPVSGIAATEEVMAVFTPGDHGSTFGGNPLGCAVARAAIHSLCDEHLIEASAELGPYFMDALRGMNSPHVKEVRGKGLFIGVEVHASSGLAKAFCKKLMAEGILCKDTHEQVIRFAPPLVVTKQEIDDAMEGIRKVFA